VPAQRRFPGGQDGEKVTRIVIWRAFDGRRLEPRLSGFVLGVRGVFCFLGVQAMFQNYGRRLKTGLVELSLVPPWSCAKHLAHCWSMMDFGC